VARIASIEMGRGACVALAVLCAAALAGCESGRYGTGPGGGGGGGGGGGTTGGPSVQISLPSLANFPVRVGDSVLVQFRVTAATAVIKQADLSGVALRGDVNLGTDTAVTRFVPRAVAIANRPDTTLTRYLRAVPGDSTSEVVQIIVTATDTSNNVGADTISVRITSGPALAILKPSPGSQTSPGKSIVVQVQAVDAQGVRVLGWRASGVATSADSVILSSASGTLPDSVVFTDTLAIPATAIAGALDITAFASDSIGDPSASTSPVTVTVQTAATDVTAPLVTYTVTKRVEGDDSITVTVTDPSGVTRAGFVVRVVGATTVVAADSVTGLSGTLTDITETFALKLDTITTFPRLVTVEAFGVDAAGNRGLSTGGTTPVPATGTASKDTVTVVAGKTFSLPAGGSIADAIYNRNRNELYLSNLTLNRLEIFQVATNAFVAGGIPVGSRPFGLSLWPRDTLGNYGDTVIVANSGGTNLSIVDVGNRVERRRHRLPNYLVRKIKTAVDPTTGFIILDITEYDFSDRPLYVGTACRNNCANVFAVYSTTPTPGQTLPLRGYVAWEEITAPAATPNGHFFWEPATQSASLTTDTLEVIGVRDTVAGQARRDTILGGAVGVTADFEQIGYQDSTYVRNSGDFNHAVIGEGGGSLSTATARAFTWDSRTGTSAITGGACTSIVGTTLSCNGILDGGISGGVFVRDFIGNRSSRVTAVATNYNGRTNFVRADSVYVFDWTLRQTGILQVAGLNPGMDVNPNHRFDAAIRGSGGFGGSGSPNDRVVYAARPDANLEVFDTYWYQSIAIIPVRDPIIGPVRVALNGLGQQVLVAVTANGVVVVPLATVSNPLPIRAMDSTRRR